MPCSHSEQTRTGSNQYHEQVVCKHGGKKLLVAFATEVDEQGVNATKWAQDRNKLSSDRLADVENLLSARTEEVSRLQDENSKLQAKIDRLTQGLKELLDGVA